MYRSLVTRFFALILLLTAGCSTASLQELREADLSSDSFMGALAIEYLDFAESEARQYDWIDSKYFADKGLLAAYGNMVAPEDPNDWNIPSLILPELIAAREKLMDVVNSATKEQFPERIARVQYFYDCWVEQQEENWQLDDIESCKHWFYNALADLAPSKETLIGSAAYLVFFDVGKTSLNAAGMAVVSQVAQDLAKENSYEIVLNGHSDTAGDDETNLLLSEKRALAVKAALIEKGIRENAISHYAFGESDAKVERGDNAFESSNRRVEIFLYN